MQEPSQSGLVLAIDDSPANLDILAQVLRAAGFRVRTAPSGTLGLESARLSPPDLILLDIRMPGMDGFAVCEALQRDPSTRDVPVIFLSALDDAEDKVKAFRCGGVDYLTKPFQAEEILIRVRHQLQLRRLREELIRKNRALEQANLELLKADRLKQELAAMLAHDLRSPLGAILMILERHSRPDSTPDAVLQVATNAVILMDGMLKDLIDVYRAEDGELPLDLQVVDLVEIARERHEFHRLNATMRKVEMELVSPGERLPARGDRRLVQRALDNLIGNAVKFTPPNGHIRISCEPAPGDAPAGGSPWAAIHVEDTGEGIPADRLPDVFDPFRQISRSDRGFGLGLAIVQRIMSAHGGRVSVRSQLGVGTTFTLLFPALPGPGEPRS